MSADAEATVPVRFGLDLRAPGSAVLHQVIIGGGSPTVLIRAAEDPERVGALLFTIEHGGTGRAREDITNLAELLSMASDACLEMLEKYEAEAAIIAEHSPSSTDPDEVFDV